MHSLTASFVVLCFFSQAQFGRRWTKIAKLVGSRTVLQVKSYARQYFKHKVRLSGCVTLLIDSIQGVHTSSVASHTSGRL